MKKFLILFIVSLPVILIGYFKLQAYQEKNWKTFFEDDTFSLYKNQPLAKLFNFADLLHLNKPYPQIAKLNICLYQDDILKKNRIFQAFNHKKLKTSLKTECAKIALHTENKEIFYKNAWNLCKDEKNCKTILFELDNFFVLENEEVIKIKNNKISTIDYNLFFKEFLGIDNPKEVVFLGFNNTGLGNNLFQYWSAYIYAQKNQKKLIPLSNRRIHTIFKNIEKSPEKLSAFKHKNYRFTISKRLVSYTHKQLIIAQNPIDYNNLKGYENLIREKMVFQNPLNKKNKAVVKQMANEESVTIHIRRGDFKDQNIKILDISYYENALKYIKQKIKNPHFYVFSDDINWAKNNFKVDGKITFVDWNTTDYEDLQLMTYTKHHIIANSSFSWWGAFLKKDTSGLVLIPQTGFYTESNPERMALKTWIPIK